MRKPLGAPAPALPSTSVRPSCDRLSPPAKYVIPGIPYAPRMSVYIRTWPSFVWICSRMVSRPEFAGTATMRNGPLLPSAGGTSTPGPPCWANGPGPSPAAAGAAARAASTAMETASFVSMPVLRAGDAPGPGVYALPRSAAHAAPVHGQPAPLQRERQLVHRVLVRLLPGQADAVRDAVDRIERMDDGIAARVRVQRVHPPAGR